MALKLYCVTNWSDYSLVKARSPEEAVHQTYPVNTFVLMDNRQLSEDTAVSVMCCEYSGFVENNLEQLPKDYDRVLWLHLYPDTLRYQRCTECFPNPVY